MIIRAARLQLLSRILIFVGIIALLAPGPKALQCQSRPDPPALGKPFDLPTPVEPAREIYPALGDLDGDGRADLLTGSDNCCDLEPGIYWFRRAADGVCTATTKVRVKVVGGDCLFMSRFRATPADWDSDGRREFVAALDGTQSGLYRSAGAWSP